MNVLVLGSRIIGVKLAEDLVKAFLGARFTNEDRHVRRLGKVKAIEDKVLEYSPSTGTPAFLDSLQRYYQRRLGIALHDCGWPIHDERPTLNAKNQPLDEPRNTAAVLTTCYNSLQRVSR